MSSYVALTKHPKSGQWQPATWFEDSFGRYKVQFTDGQTFPEDQINKELPPIGSSVAELPSKVVQIQAVGLPGDSNSGPHVQIFALCEDGSIWQRFDSSGRSNVPTDSRWRLYNQTTTSQPRHAD